MSELAFNVNGEPFEIPGTATAWRVRKLKPKGAPEVVYGRDGTPLILPIDTDLDDLRAEVGGVVGRYRLDPIDDAAKPIANAQAGYVYLHPERGECRDATPPTHASASLPAASDHVVIEAMRMNAEVSRMHAEMSRTIIERFPMMLESAATLIRAADGAGLPSRAPRGGEVDDTTDDDDDECDDDELAPSFDLQTTVAQLVPHVITGLMNGKLKMPGIGEVLDWRKAAASGRGSVRQRRAKATEATESTSEPTDENVEPAIPPLDPDTIAHFMAIQTALQPDEAAVARSVAAELGPRELRGWFDELKKLSVPDAVTKIRELIHKEGGAS